MPNSPEQPYCSRCRRRGHIPVKCPLKKQGNQQQDDRCESDQGTGERCNLVNGQGIYNYSPQHFTQQSSQQHSQQSKSTIGSSTPMLTVSNSQGQGFQDQPKRQQTPSVPQVNQQVRPPTPHTFNQQYNQYLVPQASPLLAQPQYNPQISPPYPDQLQQ